MYYIVYRKEMVYQGAPMRFAAPAGINLWVDDEFIVQNGKAYKTWEKAMLAREEIIDHAINTTKPTPTRAQATKWLDIVEVKNNNLKKI